MMRTKQVEEGDKTLIRCHLSAEETLISRSARTDTGDTPVVAGIAKTRFWNPNGSRRISMTCVTRALRIAFVVLALMPLACGPSEEQRREDQYQRDIQTLSAPDRRARMEAARAVASHKGDKRSVNALLSALAHEEDPEVREVMIEALGDLGDPEATPVLVALLTHEDPEVQRLAVIALGKIGKQSGDKRAVPALIDRLARGVPWVRAISAAALHQITGHAVEIDWLDEFAIREGVRLWEAWEKEHRHEIPVLVEAPVAPAGEREPWWRQVDREGAAKKKPSWPEAAEPKKKPAPKPAP
jgi:hypothetical protein